MNFIEALEPLKSGKYLKKKDWVNEDDSSCLVWMTKQGDLLISRKSSVLAERFGVQNLTKDEWIVCDSV